MKILMLTQWFQPEPTFKGLPLARALRDRGHEVEVLTGFPNYPGGKLYPGYRVRPWSRETMDGIRVNRVALYPSHNSNARGRILNYLSFGATSALVGPWLVRKPDVIYVFNLVTLDVAAGLLRLLRGGRTVLDVQDLWPESLSVSGMMKNRLLLGSLDRWCRAAYRHADRIITLSHGFKRHLVNRGVPEDRVEVIYNWCDEASLVLPGPDPGVARELGFAGRFNIVFAGNMGPAQALSPVIEAARRLRNRAPDVLFTIIGGGIEADQLKQSARDLPNVQFMERRPMSEVGAVLSNADALLVHLKADPLFKITIPSKIQATCLPGGRYYAASRGTRPTSYVVRARDCPLLPRIPTRSRRQFLLCVVLTRRGSGLWGTMAVHFTGSTWPWTRVSGAWKRRSSRSWLYRRGCSDGRRFSAVFLGQNERKPHYERCWAYSQTCNRCDLFRDGPSYSPPGDGCRGGCHPLDNGPSRPIPADSPWV